MRIFITDVYVLVLYAEAGGTNWTFFAISLTSLIFFMIASGCIMKNTHYFPYNSRGEFIKVTGLAILQLGEAADVYAIIKDPKSSRDHQIWRVYQKILNCLIKAVPQFLLQTYVIMTKLKMNETTSAVEYISIFFSIFSITLTLWHWECVSVQIQKIFSCYSIFTFTFRAVDTISRFLLLVTFAVSCGLGYMFLFLGLDLIVVMMLMVYTVPTLRPKEMWILVLFYMAF